MGRGRAKAKQQKVARDLKYSTHFTDLDALQRELGVSDRGGPVNGHGGGDARGARNDGDADTGPADDADSADYADAADDDYESWTGTDR